MEKRNLAAVVLAAVVTSAFAGWFAGRGISSPAEVAARTASPVASPLLVPVEERELTADVVTRGTGRFGSPQKLTVATSALKANPGIVSDAVAVGASLGEGDLVLTASGRPLFLLVGARPQSRDLGPGMTGEDVRQLEEALGRLSFVTGPIDGVYDEGTEEAVRALYARAGFSPLTPSAEQLAQQRAREIDLLAARLESLAAADARVAASARLVEERSNLDDALVRASTASDDIELAKAVVTARNRAADAQVTAARTARDELLSTTNPLPTEAERAGAHRDLAVAEAEATVTRLTGARDVADAEAAAAVAARGVTSRTATLAAAASALASADTVLTSRGLLTALAEEEADRGRRLAGVQIPADEVVFVATAPVRVSEVLVGRGDQANGAAMVVTDAIVSIDAGLALRDVALVKPGMAVTIEEPSLGIASTGTVKRIAPTPGTDGVDGFHVYFETSVETPPPNLPGASVRLTIAVQSSGGRVLAVPASALTLGPNGRSRVQRQNNGRLEFVEVVPGLSAEGYVAVVGKLSKGDLVVIGFEQKQSSGV